MHSKWYRHFLLLTVLFSIIYADESHSVLAQENTQNKNISGSELDDLKWRLKQMEVRQQEEINALKTRLETISAAAQPAATTAPKSEIEDLKWHLKQMEARQQEEIKALQTRLEAVSAEVQPAAAPTTPVVTKEEVQHVIEDYLATDEAREKMGLGWSSVASATNDERSPDTLKYALSFKSPDGKYSWNFGARMEVRYTFRDRDEDFRESDIQDINLHRARVYFGGNIYSKILHYYVELDADKFNPALRDFYAYCTPLEELNVKIGYFKVPFNRQRMATSAKLLLQDRSIASDEFDQKRDTGLDIYGKPLDGHVEYHAAVFQGAGEKFSGSDNTDNKLMYVLSLRCNPLGKYDYYDETDLNYSDTLALTIGTSVVFNAKVADAKLPNTDTVDGTVDSGVKYKGLSWTNEYYIRSEDPDIGATVRSDGFFSQVGYFVLPKKLEVAARYSMVDPNKDVSNDVQKEYTGGVNYYFRTHRSKIQADFGQYVTSEGNMPDKKEHRIRLQYQIIF